MRFVRHGGLLLALIAVPALAATSDFVASRIANYRELGAAFKAVNDGLRGEPQIVLIRQSARQIRNAATQQYGWFPRGSGPQPGLKTSARPEIWTQAAQFKAAQDAFAVRAAAFQAAANGTDPAAIRAEARQLGGACKSCHDRFRNRVE